MPRKRTLIFAVLAVPLAVAGAEVFAWWWMHPRSDEQPKVLNYRLPEEREGVHRRDIDFETVEALKCESGMSATFVDERGAQLELNFFEWNEGQKDALFQAFNHQPDICLTSAGLEVQEYLDARVLEVDGEPLVFDVTRFRLEDGGALYVFKAPWTDSMGRFLNTEGATRENLLRTGPGGETFREFKLRSLQRRFAPSCARVVMASVSGFEDEEEAWDFFVEGAGRGLRIEPR